MSKLLTNENDIKIKNEINKELEFLRFNPFHKGTVYLCETIYQIYLSQNHTVKLEVDIYPIIAQKYNTTINSIKIAIFRASLNSYYECEEEKLSTYIGKKIVNKPTVLEIIKAILEHIE